MVKPVCTTHHFFTSQRTVIANNIIDTDANRKGNTTLNILSLVLFGIQLHGGRLHDGGSKLA